MFQKLFITICGILGTIVLANLYYPFIKIVEKECYDRIEYYEPLSLYFMIYIPIMIVAGLMLMPLLYDEVTYSFKWSIVTISSTHTILMLKILIPPLLNVFSLDFTIYTGLDPLFSILLLLGLIVIPFVLHISVFITFLRKQTLEQGTFYLYPKYYPK